MGPGLQNAVPVITEGITCDFTASSFYRLNAIVNASQVRTDATEAVLKNVLTLLSRPIVCC